MLQLELSQQTESKDTHIGIVRMQKDLHGFESRYSLSSQQFYEKLWKITS